MGGGHFHQSEFSQKKSKKKFFLKIIKLFLSFDIFPKSLQKMNIYVVTNRIITPIHVVTVYKHFILHVTKIILFFVGNSSRNMQNKLYENQHNIFENMLYFFYLFFFIFSHKTYVSVNISKTKHMRAVT